MFCHYLNNIQSENRLHKNKTHCKGSMYWPFKWTAHVRLGIHTIHTKLAITIKIIIYSIWHLDSPIQGQDEHKNWKSLLTWRHLTLLFRLGNPSHVGSGWITCKMWIYSVPLGFCLLWITIHPNLVQVSPYFGHHSI